MTSDSEARQLRALEQRLSADDELFVAAFRSTSALMDDTGRLERDRRVLRECLLWSGIVVVLLLLNLGSPGAAAMCLLLLGVALCPRPAAAPRRRSDRRRLRRPQGSPRGRPHRRLA